MNVNTEEKFQEIYDKYKNLVLKIAFDMTKDYYLAQDICQETFIRLYGYQDNIIVERVKSWLVVVASNLVYDHWKKSSSRREVLIDGLWENETEPIEPSSSVELERVEYRGLCSNMLEALREKNEDWYEVLILAEYLGVPRKLIAKKRGVSLSTIDNYIRKGRSWMKENFQEEYREF